MLASYIKTYTLSSPTIPAIMDEENTLQAVRAFSGIHILEIEECVSWNIQNVSLYQKNPETKHWSVLDARRFIDSIMERPYTGKAMYIIRDFDEATDQAMNALLKILEEPPEYAIIILMAKNPEAIIETIHSRTITFFREVSMEEIPEEWKNAIQSYFIQNDVWAFFGLLSSAKLTTNETLGILLYSSRYATEGMIKNIEKWIMDIYGVNEPTKNILDRVFL